MGTYIHFTDEQKERANSVDLEEFLRQRGEKLLRAGRESRLARVHHITVRGNEWYDHIARQGGHAVSFVQHYYGMSYQEAMELLLGKELGEAYPAAQPKREEPPRPFALPPPHTDMRRVYAYLMKQRHISREVVTHFVRAGLLYEDAEHHNCVFVGRNRSGTPVFASKRGTYDRSGPGFKGDVTGSDKNTAFRLPCRPELNAVLVFEAPIDLMSYCTLHRQVTSNAVALCGLHEGALDTYLRENPQLRHIVLCLDADEPGQSAVERLRAKYEAAGYMVQSRTPPCGKDWNEYLQQRGPIRERGDLRQTVTR